MHSMSSEKMRMEKKTWQEGGAREFSLRSELGVNFHIYGPFTRLSDSMSEKWKMNKMRSGPHCGSSLHSPLICA